MHLLTTESFMRRQFQSPGQLPLNFESSSFSAIIQPAKPSNVVQVNFGGDVSGTLRPKQSKAMSQSESAIIAQVLDRARRLNW